MDPAGWFFVWTICYGVVTLGYEIVYTPDDPAGWFVGTFFLWPLYVAKAALLAVLWVMGNLRTGVVQSFKTLMGK